MRTLTEYLDTHTVAALNLGCGRGNPPNCYGIDIQDFPGVDLVADLTKGIPLESDTFDMVLAEDFLEHIPQGQPCVDIMQEIYRVLKPGGKLVTHVPSSEWNSGAAYQDPYHVSRWVEKTFWYFLSEQYGKGFRSLYNIQCWFKPIVLRTYLNEWNMAYVEAVLEKELP